jgi:hypothetical protein
MLEEKEPTIGISFNLQIDSKRQLVIQSLIERDRDYKDLDGLLDKLRIASDRIVAIYEIEAIKKDIKNHEIAIRNAGEDLARVDAKHKEAYEEHANSNRRTPFKLTAQQEGEKKNALLTIDKFKQAVDDRLEEIEKLRAKIGS